jgi:hypothetical protein
MNISVNVRGWDWMQAAGEAGYQVQICLLEGLTEIVALWHTWGLSKLLARNGGASTIVGS